MGAEFAKGHEQTMPGHLSVRLNGVNHLLPWKNVAPPSGDTPVWIAYFDPRLPDLMQAGAAEIALRLNVLGAQTLVTPSSSKSEPMMRCVQELLGQWGQHTDLVILSRGKPGSPEMAHHESTAAYRTAYSPITAEGEERVMVLTHDNARKLRTARNPVIIDDVYSTGATINAVNTLLEQVRGESDRRVPVVTVMREYEKTAEGGVPAEIAGLFPAIYIPVVIGSADQLVYASSHPFCREYGPNEIHHLRGILNSTGAHEIQKRTALFALNGMQNLSTEGVFYLSNSH